MEFMQTVAFLGIGFVGLIAVGATLLTLWRGASDKPVLDSGKREGFDAFCANAGYVGRIRGLATLASTPRWT